MIPWFIMKKLKKERSYSCALTCLMPLQDPPLFIEYKNTGFLKNVQSVIT